MKSSAPDGSTILLTPASPLGHPYTYRKLPYDPVQDLLPVSGAAVFDYALAVGPMSRRNPRCPEFLAWAKANADQADFGSRRRWLRGQLHRLGARQGRRRGAAARALPRFAAGDLDMVGGQLAAVVGPTGEFMGQVKAGKVRLLARRSQARQVHARYAQLRGAGLQGLAYLGWFGFYVPAKTPGEVVQRLNARSARRCRAGGDRQPRDAAHQAYPPRRRQLARC